MKTRLPKVVARTPLPEGALAPLEGIAQIELVDRDAPRSVLLEALRYAQGFLAMVTDHVDVELLDSAPDLRIVACASAGFDNVDLAAANRRGIWVTNTPDVLTEATADLTMALILAATRRLNEAETELRGGRYRGWTLTHMTGMGLSGKTLGIAGFGRIGRAVAERALAFGMRVIYSDPGRESVGPGIGATAVSFADLLALSDVVSIHVPLTDSTRHLFDAQTLACMRRGAYLINTSRGPVVNEGALARALTSGHLAGAGIDVFENEPQVAPELLAAPNTVLLPHIGSATCEARFAMASLAALNAAEALQGREPPTPVVRANAAQWSRAPGYSEKSKKTAIAVPSPL